MTLDALADADEAAARAAEAAGVTVRPLDSLDDLTAAIGVFDAIWEADTGNTSIRPDLLRALTKAGNYAAGAFDAVSGAILGACVGFFGPPSHAELHSHIAGVLPAGLRRSVGFALKQHQRAWALRRDVTAIAWTYDPLIRRNAYFNLAKLGARPAEYLRNFYGTMDDAINAGTETDRMLVHWDLLSPVAVTAAAGKPQPASFTDERAAGAVVALAVDASGRPVPCLDDGGQASGGQASGGRASGGLASGGRASGGLASGGQASAGGPGARRFLIGVPADIEAVRLADPALAAAWRTELRDVLAPLVAAGARVTGFDRNGWYVVCLERGEG
jgi:predicted GNAT superfamily acetyltransferase